MKKAFLITSLLILLLLFSISVSAFEDSMTDTYLISTDGGHIFESVITPTVTAECMPIISMYDEDGILCGLMYGDTLPLTSGTPVVETFTVTSDSVPSSIKLMLWKTDGSFAPLCRFEQVSTSLHSEKYGMIVESSSETGVKIYTSDDSGSVTYDFADKFILSHENTLISDKANAYSYIDSLKFSFYKRRDTVLNSIWIIPHHNEYCFKDTTGYGSALYTYTDYLNNYASRMVRILLSDDNKIVSMAFADDSLFDKLNAGKTYSEAFYTQSLNSFNDSLYLNDDAKVLYFPARAGAAESQFLVYTPSTLKNGNLYYLQNFTTQSNEQIVLVTHMLTDSELVAFNQKPVENISVSLDGDGSGTIKGLNNYIFRLSQSGQSKDNNESASAAANIAMEHVAIGLQGALEGAANGYAITKNYVKNKFKVEIDAAREQINIIKNMDTSLSAGYYNELINEIPDVIGGDAMTFLQSYFLED